MRFHRLVDGCLRSSKTLPVMYRGGLDAFVWGPQARMKRSAEPGSGRVRSKRWARNSEAASDDAGDQAPDSVDAITARVAVWDCG